MHDAAVKQFEVYLRIITDAMRLDPSGAPVIPESSLEYIKKSADLLEKQNLPFDFLNYFALLLDASWRAKKHVEQSLAAETSGGLDVRLEQIRLSTAKQVHDAIVNYPYEYTALIMLPSVRIGSTVELHLSKYARVFQMQERFIVHH